MVGAEHQAQCSEGSSVQEQNVVHRRVDAPTMQGFKEMIKLVFESWILLEHSLASVDSDMEKYRKSKENKAIKEHQ